MCVNLPKLNKFVRSERYPSVTPAEAVADIMQAKAEYFTVFDVLKGYHQCPLDEESQNLMRFITPLGRFKYVVPHLVYPRSVSITTNVWMRHSLACTTSARLLMM